MEHLKFVINSSETEKMTKNLGLKSTLNLLPQIAKAAQKLSRCPISGFPVAAVGLSSDGRIFVGVNVEFPGLPLHHSIHAEQFLITNISNHPLTRLENVVVSAYPCGHCRQFLQEIRGAPDIQIFVIDQNDNSCQADGLNDSFMPLSYFLPHRFGPNDLLDNDVPLMLETRDNKLVLKSTHECNGFLEFDQKEKLINAAFDAANVSHAPYSGCPSGVALIDVDGNVYKGSYMESAAYNPSIGPAQAAVIAYMTAAEGGGGDGDGDDGGYDYGRIVGAVLVELEVAAVKQEDTVRLFLKAVSPKCDFHVFHCQKSDIVVAGNEK